MKREGHEMDVSEELIRVPLVFTSVDGHGIPGTSWSTSRSTRAANRRTPDAS